jgi:subtilase family serine protease
LAGVGHLAGRPGIAGLIRPVLDGYLASTGDAGSPGEYPAASHNVVAVGGTTLTLASSSGGYGGETGWAGSGGGVSPFEYEPAYQHSVQAIGARTTPDVSMLADPSPGVWIYDSWIEGPGWYAIGGTSLCEEGSDRRTPLAHLSL